MFMTVLGSSSLGNCYILQGNDEYLIIEAGVQYKSILQAVGYRPDKVAGCLCSHGHGDHAKFISSITGAAIDAYMSAGTLAELNLSGHRVHAVKPFEIFRAGGFSIIPFPVEHDAAEPFGYLINHAEMGTLLFATDTCYVTNQFSGLNHIMIECNYEPAILQKNYEDGVIVKPARDRIINSHMSLGTCIDFLTANDLRGVRNIVLLHTSGQNGNRRMFADRVSAATGKLIDVAAPRLQKCFSIDPFGMSPVKNAIQYSLNLQSG